MSWPNLFLAPVKENRAKRVESMTSFEDMVKKPGLHTVLGTFIYFCTDDTSRMFVDKATMMRVFADKWGATCENAPEELRVILKNVYFYQAAGMVWSEQLGDCFGIFVTGGSIAWIANTSYYWVEKSHFENSKIKLSAEVNQHLEELAKEYRARVVH